MLHLLCQRRGSISLWQRHRSQPEPSCRTSDVAPVLLVPDARHGGGTRTERLLVSVLLRARQEHSALPLSGHADAGNVKWREGQVW